MIKQRRAIKSFSKFRKPEYWVFAGIGGTSVAIAAGDGGSGSGGVSGGSGGSGSGEPVTIELPPTTSQYGEIVVTPQNYRTILTNVGSVDFTGSNSEYVQINLNHNMLAIPCTYTNVELEAEVYIVQNTQTYAIQLQSRTYTHPGTSPGNGAAYKARFGNTDCVHVKEVVHTDVPNGYCANRADGAVSYASLIGKWTTLKFRTYNLPAAGGVVPVHLQAYVNNSSVCSYEDDGGWACAGDLFAFGESCANLPRRQWNSSGALLAGVRTPSEIINTPLRWVLFRSDGDCIWRFRRLVAREITI